MGFAGNLRTLSLAEVVQTLHRIKADGVLRLASPTATRDILFSQGDIIGVSCLDGSDRKNLLKRLVLANRARPPSADEFNAADHTITTLVEIGAVTSDDLQDQAKQQALEELYDLNTWAQADFVFHETSESDEWAACIEAARQQPLEINVNSVLMEAARRLDEWELLKNAFGDDQVVRLIRASDADLERFSREYPGSVLIPLLDGPRAIEDLLDESGVTRFATYGLLSDLMEAGLLGVLSIEELEIEADRLAGEGDHVRAAQIYRRALASTSAGTGVMAKLAASLEQLGDAPDAAGCYAQLALSQMDDGHGEVAVDCAQRAVALAPGDPDAHVALARCLIGTEQVAAAVEELRILAALYQELGRVEDARVTYRKILDLMPGDDSTRHALAAIQVRQEGAGDVVVCVECGAVNQRELEECNACSARLHLQCLTCARTVSVADRICVFCGADPHTPPTGESSARRAPVGPSTERVSDPSKLKQEVKNQGSTFWRAELRRLLDEARAHEAAGRLDQALATWREVSHLQSDNPEVVQHLRDLETVVHDQFTEREIERGHRLKHQRRYWRALLAYRAALRTLGETDPRVPPLRQLIDSTRRSSTRIFGIYLAAFAILLITAGLVAKPYFDVRMIGRRAQATSQLLAGTPTAEAISAAAIESAELRERSAKLSGAHRSQSEIELADLDASLGQARERFLLEALTQIERHLAQQEPEQAMAAIVAVTPIVDDAGDERLRSVQLRAEQLQRTRQDAQQRRQQAPELLAKAEVEEQAGHLGVALRLYREVAGLSVPEVSGKAATGVQRLEPLATAFIAARQAVDETLETDLIAGQARLERLIDEAGKWDATEALAAKRKAVAERLAAAEAAWKAIPGDGDAPALEAFLAQFANAPQANLARARLGQLTVAARTRAVALGEYREAVAAKQWERVYALATLLHRSPGLAAGEVRFPLVIESEPSGALVSVDGVAAGRTPLTVPYEPATAPKQITVTLAGYRTRTLNGADVLTSWRVQLSLDRQALWSVALGKPIGLLAALSDGGCIVGAGDQLVRLQGDGSQRWSYGVASDDLGEGRMLSGPLPLDLGAGRLALALGAAGFLLIDDAGAVVRSIHSEQPVLGRPVRYRSDILAGQERVAFAAEAIYAGPLDGEPSRLPLPAPAIAGPLVVPADVDHLLVIADVRGHFVAVEESTARLIWDKDMRCAEVAGLVQIADQRVLGIVDGSRLVSWKLSATGVQEIWSQRLDAPAVGAVAVLGGIAHLASGETVTRVRLEGGAVASLALPSPASAGVSGLGDHLAVGCRQHVVVFKDGKVSWTSPCAAPVTALAIGAGKILVGLADGTVAAFQP